MVYFYDEEIGEGNGFSFMNFNVYDMLYMIYCVIEFYYDKLVWEQFVK